MSHNLTIREDGQAEYAYAGETPWHKLGTAVAGAMTAEEAIRAANLTWTVSKRQLMTLDGVDCPDFFATVRDDNNLPLGMVGNAYTPLQNHVAFAAFDGAVGDIGGKYVSCGSIDNGKRIFLLAEVKKELIIRSVDPLKMFLLLTHSHDGTAAIRFMRTAVRVVCQNTLNQALGASQEGLYARHTKGAGERIVNAGGLVGVFSKSMQTFAEQAEALASVVVNVQQVEKFIREVFEVPENAEDTSSQKQEAINTVLGKFENGELNRLPGIAGTAWALLNATTEFADHMAPSVTDTEERRFKSAMFGTSNDLKNAAFKSAMALVK